jgi:dynein heavy chain
MECYDRVNKMIGPKRLELAEAESTLAEATSNLKQKQALLAEVQAKLAKLNKELEVSIKKKKQLETEVEECAQRLERAEKLIGGLSGEKGRWAEKAAKLAADYNNVVGNILISSGLVAYLG